MLRTRGKVIGVTVAIAATGLLAACGDNDSTASSTPTLTRTTTATPSATSAQSTEQTPAQPPADTGSPERPQPVPTEAAPPADTKLTDKDRRFLDELNRQGVTYSSPDIALSIGSYVCRGAAAGASEQDLMTFVSAMAGSDPSFDPAKMPVERAGQIYIDTAKQTYCQ